MFLRSSSVVSSNVIKRSMNSNREYLKCVPSVCLLPSRQKSVQTSDKPLKARLQELVPLKQEEVKKFRMDHGSKVVGNVTVDMVCNMLVYS
ncbi:hypothetical protein HMI56_006458 [Coelomomyces lativittatus]|nr:hypothetical protein HMI56_006458 [Coelomomyces lativittatus]